MATEDGKQGESAGKTPTSLGGEGGTPGEAAGGDQVEPKSYDEAYVKTLRDEAAANRVKAKRVEETETRLRSLAVADAVRGVLQDPADLPWSDDLADDDGWPDPDKITAAAEQLVAAKPHLARPAGDIGQGRHSEHDDTVSLSSLLRAGA